MAKREKFKGEGPEVRELVDRIVHGAFLTEGTAVAFPTCFPGVTIPVRADESHITALDVTADGVIYAGTSGRACHLLVGMFHGVTGVVFDMGTVEGADRCTAICCGQQKFVAAANGPKGGRLVTRKLQPLPFDLIQEWHFTRPSLDYVEAAELGNEPILHLVGDGGGQHAIGVTPTRLFRFSFESSKVEVIGSLPGRARLARGSAGSIFGPDDDGALWRYSPAEGTLTRKAVRLPAGSWDGHPLLWGRNPVDGTLYTADAEGRIFRFDETNGFSGPLAQTPVAPVGPMAVTFDGRLFGSYGTGMAKLFCYDPDAGTLTSLGVAVSVFERRRYGYCFGDAAVGRDGEIVFAEDDDLGHLWLYFPRVRGKVTRK